MTFTAIDFETADAHVPCEIGLCRVEDGTITATWSHLIKPSCFPYMNHWCRQVHGISAGELAGEPDFGELWNEMHPWLEDTVLIAHNAAFDMAVLRDTLHRYDLATPHSDYLCSVSLSRRIWKGLPSYSLDSLCRLHDIRFRHHRAGADAEACARLVLTGARSIDAGSVGEMLRLTGLKQKKL
jgi:DNA polymerase-3 subunit epsilon